MRPRTEGPIPTEAVLLHSIIELTREKGELLPLSLIVRHTVEEHITTYERVKTRLNYLGTDPDTFRKHLYKMIPKLIEMRYLREENGLIGLHFDELMNILWTKKGVRSHNAVLNRLQKLVNHRTDLKEAVNRAKPITQARKQKEKQPALSPKQRDKNFKTHLKELKALYESDPETTYRDVEHAVSLLKIRTSRF